MNDVIKSINVDGVEYDIQAKELTKVTYAELKELRDNGGLVAGHLYRITDYEFTTKQVETKSAGHVFDIIVLAVAENELSHIARAVAHEGDTYFDGNDLGAWELWYELDNDAEKYAWADAENGKGIIYRMIDEKRNDCPYDFKNALFYSVEDFSPDSFYYTFSFTRDRVLEDASIKDVRGYIYRYCYNKIGVYLGSWGRVLNKNIFIHNKGGKGIQHNMIGEECFDNIFIGDTISNELRFRCDHNKIYEGYGNVLGQNCQYNLLNEGCENNIFNNKVSYCSVGKNCCYNLLECGNASISIGSYCCHNVLKTDFHSIQIGSYCDNNIIIRADKHIKLPSNTKNHTLRNDETSVTNLEEYYDDGSGQLVPIKHPDLSTQPSILPYKFMGNYVYEQLIPHDGREGHRYNTFFKLQDLAIQNPMFLEAQCIMSNGVCPCDIKFYGMEIEAISNEQREGIKFVRVVYTSMPDEGGYYYGYGDDLPHEGIVVQNTSDAVKVLFMNAYNNQVELSAIGENIFHYEGDYKEDSQFILRFVDKDGYSVPITTAPNVYANGNTYCGVMSFLEAKDGWVFGIAGNADAFNSNWLLIKV